MLVGVIDPVYGPLATFIRWGERFAQDCAILDREVPGIAEAIRSSGLAAGSTDAGLSRGLAGISGSTLVVNIAGSRAAVRDGMATLGPMAAHVIAELSSLEM